jgi:hypothetical protein
MISCPICETEMKTVVGVTITDAYTFTHVPFKISQKELEDVNVWTRASVIHCLKKNFQPGTVYKCACWASNYDVAKNIFWVTRHTGKGTTYLFRAERLYEITRIDQNGYSKEDITGNLERIRKMEIGFRRDRKKYMLEAVLER